MSIKLGISPIAWSNDDMPELGGDTTLEQCLSETSKAGFSGIESGGKFPKNSSELLPKLEKENLNVKHQLEVSSNGEISIFEKFKTRRILRNLNKVVSNDFDYPDARRLSYSVEDRLEAVRLYGNIYSYAYYYLDLLVGGKDDINKAQRASVIADTGTRFQKLSTLKFNMISFCEI